MFWSSSGKPLKPVFSSHVYMANVYSLYDFGFISVIVRQEFSVLNFVAMDKKAVVQPKTIN